MGIKSILMTKHFGGTWWLLFEEDLEDTETSEDHFPAPD